MSEGAALLSTLAGDPELEAFFTDAADLAAMLRVEAALAAAEAEAGLIALVETGDPIEIDIPNRTIRLAVDDAALAERRADMTARGSAAWKPFGRKRDVSPALRAYAAMTTNASKGAVRDVSQVEHS